MEKISVIAYIDDYDLVNKFCEDMVNSLKKSNICYHIYLCNSKKNFKMGVSYNNVIVLNMLGKTKEECYTYALNNINNGYVHFTFTSSQYSKNAIAQVVNKMKEDYNMISLKPYYNNAGKLKRYTLSINQNNSLINLKEDFFSIQLLLQGYFIKYDLLQQVSYNYKKYMNEADIFYLLDILMKNRQYYILDEKYIYTVSLEDNFSTNPFQYLKWWYTDTIKDNYIPYLEKYNNDTVLQNVFLYLLYMKFECNLNDRNKGTLKGNDIDDFLEMSRQLLKRIDDEIIIGNNKMRKYKILRSIKILLLRIKYGSYSLYAEKRGNDLYFCNQYFSDINNENINITSMNVHQNYLEIYAIVSCGEILDRSHYTVGININGQKIKTRTTENYGLMKLFGKTYYKKHNIHVSIPLSELTNNTYFQFYLEIDGNEYDLIPKFSKAYSKFVKKSRKSYWMFKKNYSLNCINGKFIVKKVNFLTHFIKEIKFMIALFLHTKKHIKALKYLLIRILYWITKPYYNNKKIIITFDKLYKAGDDGEYFFKYCNENQNKYNVYYYISKESDDYFRLKEYSPKNVVTCGTLKEKLLTLNAKAIAATHATVMSYSGFLPGTHKFFKDLFNAQVICIQHGLTVQKIAQYQNIAFDDTALYCCASKYEVMNLKKKIYGFEDKHLKLVGLARYDGLINNDKKIILITPTWRRNIVETKIAFKKKSHSDIFKNTEYYRLYNSLINDKNLIELAKQYGYRIIYLLHPAMSAQMEDYEKNGYVEIIPGSSGISYEKILTESSLMITDYSGVQFDFAYMRKPILYYHPKTLPPHYEEGGTYKYDENGFGPIIDNHQELIDNICYYIKNGCKIEKKYLERANDFFAFDDHNNCMRIYQEIDKFLEMK